MKFIKTLALIVIIFVAIAVYFYKLGQIPPGLYVDEALSGYNAYSILKTGRDEYGKLFPLAFRFFGSYSPPLYVYLTTLPVKMFELSVFSTRFVSALSGVLMSVIFYYTLAIMKIGVRTTRIFLTLFFVLSPWNVILARAGYEIYLGFLIYSAAVILLYRALTKPKYVVPGALLLSLSTYGAHTQRYLAPLFLLGYSLLFWPLLKKNTKRIRMALVVLVITQLPNLYLLATPAFFAKTSLFFTDRVIMQATKIELLPQIVAIPFSFMRELGSQYISYFSPRSLFLLGDSDLQRSAPEIGVFYSWMVIPYIVGLYSLYKRRKDIRTKYIFFLALIAPLFTSLVGDPFSSQRVLPLLFPLGIIIAYGTENIFGKIKKFNYIGLSLLLGFSTLMLWRSYFVLLGGERREQWNYGYRELAEQILIYEDEKFVIDQTREKPSYIELLFFLKYSPGKLHQEMGTKISDNYYYNVDFDSYYDISNFETRNIVWEDDVYRDLVLVGDEFAISEGQAKEHHLTKVFEITNPSGGIVFRAYKTDPLTKCSTAYSVNCKK